MFDAGDADAAIARLGPKPGVAGVGDDHESVIGGGLRDAAAVAKWTDVIITAVNHEQRALEFGGPQRAVKILPRP